MLINDPHPTQIQKQNPLNHLANSISSYDSNIMLDAVISLLLVILFVLLLHIYAKRFLAHARHRRRPSSDSISHVLRSSTFHHFHTFTLDNTTFNFPSKGLDPSIISSIPLFIYKTEEHKQSNNKQGIECVICLSPFEENEIGRKLNICGHVFHIGCIDMWLNSHSSCPICRCSVLGEKTEDVKSMEGEGGVGESREVVVVMNDEVEVNVVIDVSNSENERGNLGPNCGSSSLSESSSSSSIGSSLKRMLSRNRSDQKVFPSSTVTQLDA